jgi:hypothetical protein
MVHPAGRALLHPNSAAGTDSPRPPGRLTGPAAARHSFRGPGPLHRPPRHGVDWESWVSQAQRAPGAKARVSASTFAGLAIGRGPILSPSSIIVALPSRNAGHSGRPFPFGSPVLMKFTQ